MYREIIRQMTLDEKAMLFSGRDNWNTIGYEKYGIPSVCLSDGPHGIRRQIGAADHLGLNESQPATCFPTAATIANSWDEQLAEEVGECLGREAAALDVDILLGPGLNIKRNPLCGRNFEYFSEDPYLSGKMAAAYIRGIQQRGVAACPKHFAANSQELWRMNNNSILDERTFREIYTTGFEIAVKEGKAKAIMTAYNRVNGIYANENKHLLQDILKREWKFDGIVVSDWGGSNDHVEGVKNGSHLEMPATGSAGARELVSAVQEGRLTEELLDKRLEELLTVITEMKPSQMKKTLDTDKQETSHEFARRAARESIVLLKNEDRILPLAAVCNTAVIGEFAELPRYQGAGSSLVNSTKLETTLGVMKSEGFIWSRYHPGYRRGSKTNPEMIRQVTQIAKDINIVLLYVGLDEINESEGMDRTHMKMPQNQLDVIDAVTAVNSNVIVILSAGSVVEMPWISKVKAVIHGYLGGQAGAGAMLDILTGAYCPSGKLNETYPHNYEDTPSYSYYPGKEYNSEYRESIFVGYRYYETVGKKVMFPFGYGLSYTEFDYRNLKVTAEGVSFYIKNTGNYAGAEIAQLYISKKSEQIFYPVKELKGFQKKYLYPGDEKEVKIPFDDKTFRYYNHITKKWEIEGGVYEVQIGTSVADIRLQSSIIKEGTGAPCPYIKENMKDYFAGTVTQINDSQFEELLDYKISDGCWDKEGKLGINDAIGQMYYAKSLLARMIWYVLTRKKNRSVAKGKPNLNIMFLYNMPFRGIAKMTGGMVTMDMVHAIVEMVNGKLGKGLIHLLKAWNNARERE